MSNNGGGKSVEDGAVAVESSSTLADGGKRSDVHKQLLQTPFYRGGVVGGVESWTWIGRR
jgi:hypothetical protein